MNAPREMNQIICMLGELHQRRNDVLVRSAVKKFGDLYNDRLGNQAKSSFKIGVGAMVGGAVMLPVAPFVGVATFYGGYFKFYAGLGKRAVRDLKMTSRTRNLDLNQSTSTQILHDIMKLDGGDDDRSARYLFVLCCLGMQKYYLHYAIGLNADSMSDREWINQYATEIHEILQASHIAPDDVVYFFSETHPTFNWLLINSETLERIYTAAAQRYLTEARGRFELAAIASFRFSDRAQNLQQRISASILFPDSSKPQQVLVRIDPCYQEDALGCLEHLLKQLRCDKGNQDQYSLKGLIMDELFKLPGFSAAPQNSLTPSQLSIELAVHLYDASGRKPYELPDALPMVASLLLEIDTLRRQNADISSILATYDRHIDSAWRSLSSEQDAWYALK